MSRLSNHRESNHTLSRRDVDVISRLLCQSYYKFARVTGHVDTVCLDTCGEGADSENDGLDHTGLLDSPSSS